MIRTRKIFGIASAAPALALLLCCAGCRVGPRYRRTPIPAPPEYRELTPETAPAVQGWKVAQPSDATMHGQWWQIFNDPQLDALERQVNISNQTIAAAAQSYLAARALVREAHAQYFPTLGTAPAITRSQQPAGFGIGGGAATGVPTGTTSGGSRQFSEYSLPFDATWVPDLWGRIRNAVASAAAGAQASAADLENVRLTAQAELAVDYFSLRDEDALKELVDSTVRAYQESLNLTEALYETGIQPEEAVAQARTQLETTQAEDTAIDIVRAQFEHAIATLLGQSASVFSLPTSPLASNPRIFPFGVPSELLERRPDIAAAERLMAQANAQIGIATAAFYPAVTLTGDAGFISSSIATWLTWPSRFWSVGASVSEAIFDAGLRRATVRQFRAAYEQTVANYRQTVLVAFQQVEDNLAALRLLSVEIEQQQIAVQSAELNLQLATDRYRLGIDPYLNVITAQTTLLSSQQILVNLGLQQMTASVQLIEALGGGWNSSQLPSAHDVASAPVSSTAGR